MIRIPLRAGFASLALLAGVMGLALGASQALATGTGNCGSQGYAESDGVNHWKLTCPGSCAAPPAGQICKQGAWIDLDGWSNTQCTCYESDGTTVTGVQVDFDDPCLEWLRRRTVAGVVQWSLKCFKLGCTAECEPVQSGDPIHWDCTCP